MNARTDPFADQPGLARTMWNKLTAAAEQYNEPGRFTALIGFEWTSMVVGNNLNRNVVFQDGKDRADQIVPFDENDGSDGDASVTLAADLSHTISGRGVAKTPPPGVYSPPIHGHQLRGYRMIAEDERLDLPEDRLWQPVTARWFAVVFGASLAYAVLRYHVASEVSWSHFPLFILNKATSLAAVVFVACSYLVRKVIRWHQDDPKLQLVVIKFCGLAGFSLAAIHALFSVCLLTPAYFAKFFADNGRLNLVGELGLAVGVVALWALAMPVITTLPMMPKALGGFRWKRSQRMGYLCLGLVSAHMLFFGVNGWFAPQEWPWKLPPISLLAVAAAAFPLIVKLWKLLGSREVGSSQ